ACQLTTLNGSVITKDVPSSAGALGQDVVMVGTRFEGSAGLALAAFSANGGWDPGVMTALGHHVIELDDVSTVGDQAWAVGALASSVPVAAHWDGQRWIPTPVHDPGPGEDGFSGVEAVSPDLVWAVGRHQIGYGFQTLTERWDGRSWTAVPSPNVGETSNMLKDVSATSPNDVWAVGWYVDRQHYRPLMEHWDGTRWRLVSTPDVRAGDGFLSGVAAIGARDAWAVGWTAQGDSLQPLVEHWDGRTWSLVPEPAGAEHAALMAVAQTTDGVVAVGRLQTTAQAQPLALIRVGDAWTTLSSDVSGAAWFTGVTVDASGAVWAVGTQFPGNTFAESLVMTGCPAP
ncbi:MAG: hypothetical protein M3P43_00900, partial [Actinomycetota bacterium]|nr:hypothetical protein [Actinomycetota bacterium]